VTKTFTLLENERSSCTVGNIRFWEISSQQTVPPSRVTSKTRTSYSRQLRTRRAHNAENVCRFAPFVFKYKRPREIYPAAEVFRSGPSSFGRVKSATRRRFVLAVILAAQRVTVLRLRAVPVRTTIYVFLTEKENDRSDRYHTRTARRLKSTFVLAVRNRNTSHGRLCFVDETRLGSFRGPVNTRLYATLPSPNAIVGRVRSRPDYRRGINYRHTFLRTVIFGRARTAITNGTVWTAFPIRRRPETRVTGIILSNIGRTLR